MFTLFVITTQELVRIYLVVYIDLKITQTTKFLLLLKINSLKTLFVIRMFT